MLKNVSKMLLILAMVCMMVVSFAASSFAQDTEMVTGVVAIEDGVIYLVNESVGEVVVKKGTFNEKLAGLGGEEVTVEGVVTELPNGALEISIQRISE